MHYKRPDVAHDQVTKENATPAVTRSVEVHQKPTEQTPTNPTEQIRISHWSSKIHHEIFYCSKNFDGPSKLRQRQNRKQRRSSCDKRRRPSPLDCTILIILLSPFFKHQEQTKESNRRKRATINTPISPTFKTKSMG